jgi:hypothetical protein
MPSEPLPEYQLRISPRTDEARRALGYKWAAPEVGSRHQIGGQPQWLQDDETPRCVDCGAEMTFYAQLDGIGDDFDLADCGLIFVFLCFGCSTTKAVLQPG